MGLLNLDKATEIIEHTFAHAAECKAKPLAVAVLDSAGHLIALKRQDGTSMMRPDIAMAKAWGAVAMGKSSRALGQDAKDRPEFISALNTLAEGHVIPVPGGVLIKSDNDEILGAVGVTGDISDVDEACAIAAVNAAGFRTGPV